MTSRERVRTALSHRQPDRLPIDFCGTFLSSCPKPLLARIADLLGVRPAAGAVHNDPLVEAVQRHFGCDIRSLTPTRLPNWGFKDVHDAPLRNASIEDLDRYPWPKFDPAMVDGLERRAMELSRDTSLAICASQIGNGLFELGCWLRGYEQILCDLVENRDFIRRFNEKVLAVNLALGEPYFGAIGPYVDMVLFGDDLAIQTAPYMSPAMFRELYKPYFAEYVGQMRRLCPRAFIDHHCCGSSFPLLDDLADAGIQVINPVQTTATGMSPERLAAKKPRLAFHGGVDLQHVLPHGSEREVRNFVANLVAKLAPGGGYILAACHTLPEDVRPENVIVMLETASTIGS